MVPWTSLRHRLLGRDVAVAYAVVVGLYLAGYVRFQPLQVPRYLLIVAYDVVETVLPFLSPYHPVGFPLFLYLLAVLAAAGGRLARGDEAGGGRGDVGVGGPGDWYRAAGGVCLVVGAISLLFGATVGGPLVSPTDNPTPLAITGATAGLFAVAGWWLLSRGRRSNPHGGR